MDNPKVYSYLRFSNPKQAAARRQPKPDEDRSEELLGEVGNSYGQDGAKHPSGMRVLDPEYLDFRVEMPTRHQTVLGVR